MSTKPSILFLADAHIRGPDDPRQSVMEDFLLAKQSPNTCLVILGDFFDYLAGPNQAAACAYAPIIEALKKYAPYHYIEGNHDFDLSKKILGENEVLVYPGQSTLLLHGFSIRVFHGDRTCPTDIGTKVLRRALQSNILRFIRDRLVPDRTSFRLALAFARLSRRKTWPGRSKEEELTRKLAINELMQFKTDIAIFAHTHQPLLEKTDQGVIANPGPAEPGGSYLTLENQVLSLHHFPEGHVLPPGPLCIDRPRM